MELSENTLDWLRRSIERLTAQAESQHLDAEMAQQEADWKRKDVAKTRAIVAEMQALVGAPAAKAEG